MNRLNVWVRLPAGETRPAGELVTSKPGPGGRFEAEFEYAAQWSADPKAFDLDPASLARARGPRFQAVNFHPPLAVFEDALPDSWGQRLMAIAIKADGRKPTLPELLRRLGGNGLGALAFSESAEPPPETETAQKGDLAELVVAAEAFEAGRLPAGKRFHKLLDAGGTPGGARPKALLHDKGVEWIGKFPSPSHDEHHDVVGLEATCMELARIAGLEVPETRLQTVGKRRILLVRRFDIAPEGGRFHMASFKSLCKERPGIFVTGYDDLAETLRKYSVDPIADIAALFRHASFNAAVGNVDDHLKNFWMIHRHEGWRLAPAFDLVPDTAARLEHTLSFDVSHACPTRAGLVRLGTRWGVRDPAAIVAQVTKAAQGFASLARKLKGAPSVKQVAADIERRRKLLS